MLRLETRSYCVPAECAFPNHRKHLSLSSTAVFRNHGRLRFDGKPMTSLRSPKSQDLNLNKDYDY